MIANPLNSMITNYFNEAEKNKQRWLPSPGFKAFSGMFDEDYAPDTFLGDSVVSQTGRRGRKQGIAKPTDPYSKEIISGMMSGLPGILRYMDKAGIKNMSMSARPEEETYY
jgi:hypothetical protein